MDYFIRALALGGAVAVCACSQSGTSPSQGAADTGVVPPASSQESDGEADPGEGNVDAASAAEARCDDGVVSPRDWPSFGRDLHNSRRAAEGVTLNADNVGQLESAWRFTGDAEVSSTPTVVAGVVYYADYAGTVWARRVLDGSVVWRQALLGLGGFLGTESFTATASVTCERVYIAGQRSLFALARRDGEVLWTSEVHEHPKAGVWGSPVLAGDRLLLGVASVENVEDLPDYTFRGRLVAIDAETGQELWRFHTTDDDEVSGAGVGIWSTPSVDLERGVAYVGTGQNYEAPAGPLADGVIALDLEDGTLLWHRQFVADDIFRPALQPWGADADVGAAPNLFQGAGRDLVGAGNKAGDYYALDRDTGEVVWMTPLTGGSHLGGVMVTAAAGDGRLFVTSNNWSAAADDPTMAFLPLLTDTADTSDLFALSMEDGEILWRQRMHAPQFGAMTLAADVLFLGNIDATVQARAAEDGRELWSEVVGVSLGGGQSVVDGTLFVSHGFMMGYPFAVEDLGGIVAFRVP